MTDTPKRIYAWSDVAPGLTGTWCVTRYPDAAEAYILAAEHDRMMAEKDAEIARLHDKLCVVKMVIETLRARQDTVRNNALEDAARMVDCACECRDAVLAAKTKVDRWNACGRDPCCALDAADIRALKGGGQ